MISLLYVSRSAIPSGSEMAQVTDIVAVAQRRNLALKVTGALILMDGLFGQVLEGPEAEVNQLMVAILKDRRHSDVRIVELTTIAARRFPSWSMAYVPPSIAARGLLRALVEPRTEIKGGANVAELVALMISGASSAQF